MLHKQFLILCLFLSMTLTMGDCQTQRLATMQTTYTVVADSTAGQAPELEALLSNYRQQLSEKMDVIVGHTIEPMSKGRPESKLGNLLCDIILDKAQIQKTVPVDFAVQNLGGIRIPTLGAGNIKKGLIYEIMPFDNEIVIVKLKGNLLAVFMDNIAAQGGIPISRGIKMKIENRKVANLTINDEPLDANRDYYVAMPDFMANGGDSFEELKIADRTLTGILIRDAIIDHFLEMTALGKPVTAKMEKRITD